MRNAQGQFIKGSEPYNKKTGYYKKCLRCQKKFYVKLSEEKYGFNKYCSIACKNKPVFNICKNCKKEFRVKPSHADKRTTCSQKCRSEIMKNQKGYWVNKKRPDITGEKNNKWKGEKAGYVAFHSRVKRKRGNANGYPCTHKDKTCKGKNEWASISHNANSDIYDYMPLCHSHHARYDGWQPKR